MSVSDLSTLFYQDTLKYICHTLSNQKCMSLKPMFYNCLFAYVPFNSYNADYFVLYNFPICFTFSCSFQKAVCVAAVGCFT